MKLGERAVCRGGTENQYDTRIAAPAASRVTNGNAAAVGNGPLRSRLRPLRPLARKMPPPTAPAKKSRKETPAKLAAASVSVPSPPAAPAAERPTSPNKAPIPKPAEPPMIMRLYLRSRCRSCGSILSSRMRANLACVSASRSLYGVVDVGASNAAALADPASISAGSTVPAVGVAASPRDSAEASLCLSPLRRALAPARLRRRVFTLAVQCGVRRQVVLKKNSSLAQMCDIAGDFVGLDLRLRNVVDQRVPDDAGGLRVGKEPVGPFPIEEGLLIFGGLELRLAVSIERLGFAHALVRRTCLRRSRGPGLHTVRGGADHNRYDARCGSEACLQHGRDYSTAIGQRPRLVACLGVVERAGSRAVRLRQRSGAVGSVAVDPFAPWPAGRRTPDAVWWGHGDWGAIRGPCVPFRVVSRPCLTDRGRSVAKAVRVRPI